MMSQKEAVFTAVTNFYGDKFENGMSHSKEAKESISSALIEAYNNGEFEIKNEQENLKSYISGLINNHLRKDTRLNGGEKYVAKNPGSRAGQSDPQVAEARKLLKTMAEGTPQYDKVKSFIDTRVAEIKAEKQKVQIDKDALPAELQGLVG